MPEFIESFSANVSVEATAYTTDGQLVTASASASASSTMSYDEAYKIAFSIASALAKEKAIEEAASLSSNCKCLETFYASANADAEVFANNGEKVTASASATASSTLNYNNAYEVALSTARSVALSTAQTDANIINQSFPGLITLENLSSSNNVYNINDNSNYFYVKGSSGNSNNMSPTFFPMGFNGIKKK